MGAKIVNIFGCGWFSGKKKFRMIPVIGPVTEQQGPVALAPQRYDRLNGAKLMAQVKMSDVQQCDLSIAFTDKKGNPAQPPVGGVQWMTDSPALLSVAVDPQNQGKATVAAVGPLGTGTVTCKVTDQQGGTLAAGSIDFEIDAGPASQINITPGTPVDQP